MASHKEDYWVGRLKDEYYFSPKGAERPPVTLDYQDWVDVRIYPNLGVPEGVTFKEVEFKDTATNQVKAVWTRSSDGRWSVKHGDPRHFLVADTDTDEPTPGRGIKITNNEQLEPGRSDSHEFAIVFSDGGCLDPELINRG